LILFAETAADLMTVSPVSINVDATIPEAVAFLIDRGFRAAPVIDKAGRPIGVVSQADILRRDPETAEPVSAYPDCYQRMGLAMRSGQFSAPGGVPGEHVQRTRVCDIMTPVVFSVTPDTPAPKAIEDMLARKIHRLFVVDSSGVLCGVLSALDVLQHLRRAEPKGTGAGPCNPAAPEKPR